MGTKVDANLIGRLSILLGFLVIAGGAFYIDAAEACSQFPWAHCIGITARFRNAVLFLVAVYGIASFVQNLVELRRARFDVWGAYDDLWAGRALGAKYPPKKGSDADKLVALELHASSPRTFGRDLAPRLWEIHSGARNLATAAVVAVIVGLIGMVAEGILLVRVAALTAPIGDFGLYWQLASILNAGALSIFFGLAFVWAYYIVREGATEVSHDVRKLTAELEYLERY